MSSIGRFLISATILGIGLLLVPNLSLACSPTAIHPPPCGVPGQASSACSSSSRQGHACPRGLDARGQYEERTSCSASPTYVGSGDYFLDFEDLHVVTPGLPLIASRTYESAHAVDGPIGFGWTSSLSAHLYYATYLFAAPSTYSKAAWITMPTGRRFRYTENADGVTYTAPAGRYDVLVKNGDGTFDLTLQRSRTKYHFAATGDLLSMTDDYGNALNMTFDGSGRPKRLTDAAGSGRYLDITYGADGRISVIADNSGRNVQYGYDGTGALKTVIDPAGRTTTFGYVSAQIGMFLSTTTDNWGRGGGCGVGFGSDCCAAASSCAGGETYAYTYRYNNIPNQTAKTDANNNTWVFLFNPAGQITDETAPDGGHSHIDYYADGSVQQTTDQVGVKTYYTYNSPQGNVLSVTKDYQGASAVRFDYAYDANFPEKVISITPKNPTTLAVDPTWQAWKYDYYQAGSAAPGALFHVYRVHDDGVTVDTMATYVYNSHGQATKYTSATGSATDYGYDTLFNPQTVTGPANNDAGARPVTTYGYDSVGRVTSVQDALTHQTTYIYDGLDRVTSVTLPKPSTSSTLTFTTTYSYDHFDSPTGLTFTYVTDPNGKLTKQGYDAYGRLVQAIDASGNVARYGYTGALLTSITDANNNVTTYGYDTTRRLHTTTFPDSTVETYTYTFDNLLDTKTDRKNQLINLDYDAFKRVKLKTYPSGAGTITYTYVGQKLTQVDDTSVTPTETHGFSYDSSYRVWSNTQASRGTINYLYNPDDTVQNYSIQTGPSATYTYYPDGSLNTIAWSPVSGTFKYRFTLAGQYQSLTLPSNATRNFTYDDQGRLTNLTNLMSGGANLATYAYAYDHNWTTGLDTMLGQRSSLTATVPSQSLSNHLFKYEYDGLYELNKVTYPNVAPLNAEVDSWTYDAIGNRLTSTVNGATASYTYQKIGSNPLNWQRLTSDGASSYTYDGNGNTQTRTGSTFTWSYDDRMTGVTGTSSYTYDYQGRRSGKTVGTSTSTYVYNGLNLVKEAGATPADYLFGPGIDEPLAMSRGGSIYYDLVDGLGSVSLVTNATGTVQDKYLYDAWGTTRSFTTPVVNPFGYTAREFGEVGTLFYRARYYQTGMGRFLQEDPLAERERQIGYLEDQHESLFDYVQNRPTVFIDPLGEINCGPLPPLDSSSPKACMKSCIARYRWANCKLAKQETAATWLEVSLGAVGMVGAGAAAVAADLPWATCAVIQGAGTAIGIGTGWLVSKFYGSAAAGAILRAGLPGCRNCETEPCLADPTGCMTPK